MKKRHIGKRKWITAFILVLCMSFLVCTSAFANYTEEVPEISLNERQCVEQAMISRGSSHNICVEPLEVWVPASTATYLYRFRYNGM